MTLLCEDLSELYSHFNEYRLEEKCCDVIIKVEERSFPCHRIILASIEYFRGMFSGKFVEAEKKEIELKGINASDFELLLTHIYGSSIKIKDENVYRLLRISHYMGPPSLENLCVNHIIKSSSIPLNTVLCIYIFACETKKTILTDELTEYMAQNFLNVSKHAKFFKIPGKELLQILTHHKLDKDSAAVLDFLNIWVRAVGEEARKLLPDLLAAVSLSNVPMEWFMKTLLRNSEEKVESGDIEEPLAKRIRQDTVNSDEASLTEDQESITKEEQCSFFVNTMEDNDLNLTRRMPFSIFSLDTRSADDVDTSSNVPSVINLYELMINRNGIHQVQHSDTQVNVIEDLFQRVHCKSVFIDGLRFMVVCVEKPVVVTTVTTQEYNCNTGRYKTIEKRTPQACIFQVFLAQDFEKSLETHTLTGVELENMAVVANETDIYLYNGSEFVMYITQRDKWVPIPTTGCVKTLSPNLLSRERNLYLVGGKSSTECADDEIPMMHAQTDGKLFQRFDLREGKWAQLPKMTYARYKSASCLYDDMLYVSGGDDLAYYKGYIERFDFKAGKWDVFETSLPEPKMRHTLIGHENQLWFFGGQNYHSKKVINDLSWYAYDLKERSWSNLSYMPTSYGKFTTKEILDVINVI